MTQAPAISTLGELKAAGYEYKTVREELRDNLLAKLKAGENPWPGLHLSLIHISEPTRPY